MSAVTRRLAALGCVGLLASSVAACGSSAKTGTSGDKASITMGAVRAFSSLDPANAYDDPSWTIFYNIYQNLVSYKPGASNPSPDAAKSCSFADSSLTVYTCTMRPGLTFTNGDPLDADAVKFSFDRMLRLNPPGRQTSGPGPLISNIASVASSGDQVTFHLKTPDASFPGEIAGGAGAIVDPKVFPADKPYTGTSPVGSGVYRVDSAKQHTVDGSNQGISISLSVNSHYQGDAGAPQNAHVTVRYFDTADELLQALKAGKIDLTASDLTPEQVAQLQNQQQVGQGVQVVSGEAANARLLIFDVKDKPFNSTAVRRAAAALIDQKALATGVQRGQADPLYSVIPSGIGGHTTPFLDTYNSPNLSAARNYLQQAGISTPVSFTLTYAKSATAGDEEAAAVKQQLEQGGLFKVTLNPLHDVTALTGPDGAQRDAFPAMLGNWYADYPDPSDYIDALSGAYNTHYENQQIDKVLLPRTEREANRLDANQAFAQIQQQIAEDAPFVPLWQGKQFMATQSDVVGVALTMDATNQVRFWMIGKGSS